jgi:hypothetical protein
MSPQRSDKPPTQIFLSYAREDQDEVRSMWKQFAIHEHNKEIKVWWDGEIAPGDDWKGNINAKLEAAEVVLLFVSPAFFTSAYCFEVEMPQALRQREAKKSIVIPIITKAVEWQSGPFAGLQVLPHNGTPLWDHRKFDSACLEVAREVMKVVRRLRGAADQQEKPRPRRPRASAISADQTYASAPDFIDALPAKLKARLKPLMAGNPRDWISDPTEDYFGKEPSTTKGRQLQIKLVKKYKSALDIELRVVRISGKTFDGPVLFLKHPSYGSDRVELVEPIGDLAKTTIQTDDWFTVAAIADRGRTILSRSLRKLSRAPAWFTTDDDE